MYAYMSEQLAWFLKALATVLAPVTKPGPVYVALVDPMGQRGPENSLKHDSKTS